MKETKLTISNKTFKVDLPAKETIEVKDLDGDVTSATPKALLWHADLQKLSLGNAGGANNTPFNGERPVVAPIPGLQGAVLGGTTNGETLDNFLKFLFPAQGPSASLSANNPTREFGASNAVVLTYSFGAGDEPVTNVSVEGVVKPLTPTSGTVNTTTAVNTDRSFNMVVTDGSLSTSAGTTVSYFNNRFWFQSATNLLTASDGDISSVLLAQTNKEFSTSRGQSRSFTLAGEYIYFAYPSSFGAASFIVGGLPNTAYQLKTFTYTNSFGYTTSYNLYRSGGAGTGSIQVVAQ